MTFLTLTPAASPAWEPQGPGASLVTSGASTQAHAEFKCGMCEFGIIWVCQIKCLKIICEILI